MKKYSNIANTSLSLSNVNISREQQGRFETDLLFDKEETRERPDAQREAISQKKNENIITMGDLILQKKTSSHISPTIKDSTTSSKRQNIFIETAPIGIYAIYFVEVYLVNFSLIVLFYNHVDEDQHGPYQNFPNEDSLEMNKHENILSDLEGDSKDEDMPLESGDGSTESESERVNLNNQDLELEGKLAVVGYFFPLCLKLFSYLFHFQCSTCGNE